MCAQWNALLSSKYVLKTSALHSVLTTGANLKGEVTKLPRDTPPNVLAFVVRNLGLDPRDEAALTAELAEVRRWCVLPPHACVPARADSLWIPRRWCPTPIGFSLQTPWCCKRCRLSNWTKPGTRFPR